MRKFQWPWLAISALIFYTVVTILTVTHILPPIHTSFDVIASLHAKYGAFGFFVAAFLEGLVYVGLYFPGTTFIVLGILLFNGGYFGLLYLSLSVTVALTIVTVINYSVGRRVARRGSRKIEKLEQQKFSKWLIFACLHPGAMSFYFFNSGLKKHNPWRMVIVPLILFPYFFLAFAIIYSLKGLFMNLAERPYLIFVFIILWIVIEFSLRNKVFSSKKDGKKEIVSESDIPINIP